MREDLLRRTTAGDICGFRGTNGSNVWMGVPYASPPVGRLRWRAPLPPAPWHGIRKARDPASPSAQASTQRIDGAIKTTYVGSEDCLYLNIWAPPNAGPGSGLPVMVWIHGGGNVAGQAHTFDSGVLATTQEVVVVTVGYRLGLMGWFTHPALRATAMTPEDASGNYGTLDLIESLRWVKGNIREFGGDPELVTVFGESAGGSNVYSLLLSPLAAGLFQRAIAQSGMCDMATEAEAENYVDEDEPGMPRSSGELMLELLVQDGSERDRTAAKKRIAGSDSGTLAAYLRSKSYVELAEALTAIRERLGRAGPYPQLFRDGTVLPASAPLEVLAAGRYNLVPAILGSTRDEFSILLPIYDGSFDFIRPAGEGVFELTDADRFEKAVTCLSTLLRAKGVDEPAAVMARWSPVYAYRFDWDELRPAPWLGGAQLGATHGLDIPFVFGHSKLGAEFFQLPLLDADSDSFHNLAAAVMSYWTEFAASGSPGRGRRGELPEWTAWDQVMILDNEHRPTLLPHEPDPQVDATTLELAKLMRLLPERRTART